MTQATFVTPNSTADMSASQEMAEAQYTFGPRINWTDPSLALWMRAVQAAPGGNPAGVPGCPSREAFYYAQAQYNQAI